MPRTKRRFCVSLSPILLTAVVLAARAFALETVLTTPVLTPKDVIAWMAPMRIENGRLGIDWGTVGLIAAKHAGVSTANDRPVSEINTDVQFLVSAAQSRGVGAAAAPEFQLVLHADGGSASARPRDGDAQDLPIDVRIVEKDIKGGLRGEFRVHGRLSKNGQFYDASEMQLNLDSATCLALYSLNRKTRDYRMKFKEDRILKADLSITESHNFLMIRLENTDVGTGFDFTLKPNGEAELTFSEGEAKRMIHASGLHELIQQSTAEMQLNFFRPLADMGVAIAPSQDLPVVMAATTTGFSEPLPATVAKADALINSISDAVTAGDRAKAVTDLTRFFPQAIFHITQAMEKTRDPNLKSAIQKSIAAHPGIANALPYVRTLKLHDDRDYLFDIFEHVPLFKDAARARLALLLGKDFGDNIEDWKK
ncbi:MAG: hypothetical protein WCT04_11740 [Planctomycetota bacterium]